MRNIVYLHNSVRNYAWGDTKALHVLLGLPNPQNKPQAELWLGAYGEGGSLVKKGDKLVTLASLIAKNPDIALGESEALKYNNKLPFLFKVITVNTPLSLQMHPNKEQAYVGFARENLLGVAFNDVNRNYKDSEGKSEILYALSDFWMLCGFRKLEEITGLLQTLLPQALKDYSISLNSIKNIFHDLLSLDREAAAVLQAEASQNLSKLNDADLIHWMTVLANDFPNDPAAFAPVFLNLAKLAEGEAVYIPARTMHAYLSGVGLELCSASDNTIRAGLTAKHVDIPELMIAVDFSEKPLHRLTPEALSAQETVFRVSGEAYGLSRVDLPVNGQIHQKKHQIAEIMLCMDGEFDLMRPGRKTGLTITKGQSMFVPHSVEGLNVKGKGLLFKAFIA